MCHYQIVFYWHLPNTFLQHRSIVQGSMPWAAFAMHVLAKFANRTPFFPWSWLLISLTSPKMDPHKPIKMCYHITGCAILFQSYKFKMAAYASSGHLEFWKMLNILRLATKLILISQKYRTCMSNKSLQYSPLQAQHCGYETIAFFPLVDYDLVSCSLLGWVGLWGFLWWAPSAKRKDHHGVSSGWSSVWHSSNTGLPSSQYEPISIILGVWPFCLTPSFFRSITFWRAYG